MGLDYLTRSFGIKISIVNYSAIELPSFLFHSPLRGAGLEESGPTSYTMSTGVNSGGSRPIENLRL